MNPIKPFIPWTIRIIVSLLFLVSAAAKLYPSPYFAISTFEVKQLYDLGFSPNTAPFFSRILIGIEFALGILLLQNHYLRKIVVPGTILLLIAFVVHLSYVTFYNGGNSGNCGCFGELIPMTPIQAIVKNIIAILLLLFLCYLLPKKIIDRDNVMVLVITFFSAILTLFCIAPIKLFNEKYDITPVVKPIIDTVVVQKPIIDTPKVEKVVIDSVKVEKDSVVTPKVVIQEEEPKKTTSGYAKFFPSIDKGKKTLCFFVPGCDHCREVAKELTELKAKNPNFPPILILFMNEEADFIPDFFKAAGAQYPYKIVEIIPFWNLLGPKTDTPGVKYIWNGNTFKYYNGITDNKFNAIDYQTLVNKPYSELKKN